MKHIHIFFIVTGLLLSLAACSSDSPQFRVRNDRVDKANVQIQTSGGNTININDVGTGQTTAYQSVNEGKIDATAVIQNESVSPTISFSGEMDERYTIVIQTGNPPALRIDK